MSSMGFEVGGQPVWCAPPAHMHTAWDPGGCCSEAVPCPSDTALPLGGDAWGLLAAAVISSTLPDGHPALAAHSSYVKDAAAVLDMLLSCAHE